MLVMTVFNAQWEFCFRNDMAAAENAAAQKQKFAKAVKGMDPATHMCFRT